MALARRGRRRRCVRLDGRVGHAVDPIDTFRGGTAWFGEMRSRYRFRTDQQAITPNGIRLQVRATSGPSGQRLTFRLDRAELDLADGTKMRINPGFSTLELGSTRPRVARQQRLADARSRLRVRPIRHPAPGSPAATAAGKGNQEDHHLRAHLGLHSAGAGKLAARPRRSAGGARTTRIDSPMGPVGTNGDHHQFDRASAVRGRLAPNRERIPCRHVCAGERRSPRGGSTDRARHERRLVVARAPRRRGAHSRVDARHARGVRGPELRGRRALARRRARVARRLGAGRRAIR